MAFAMNETIEIANGCDADTERGVTLDRDIISDTLHDNSDDDRLSLCSSQSENISVMGGEERASSSLSCSSRGSRIPRFSASKTGSLEHKSQNRPHKPDHINQIGRCSPYELSKPSPLKAANQPNIGGLYRSLSFATSRGMSGLAPSSTSNSLRCKTPLTPELQRRRPPSVNSNYVSPYSRRVIAAERKSQISQGGNNPLHLHQNHQPQGANTPPDRENEDNTSEKSFVSVSSTYSCDLGTVGFRRGVGGGGFWGGRKPKNVLHCSHAHDNDSDDYLTPTQRAARKIRELQGELKKARREIMEKDSKISILTRDLVKIRFNQAEKEDFEGNENNDEEREDKIIERNETESCTKEKSGKKDSSKRQLPSGVKKTSKHISRSFSPSCVTPPSDGSEPELRILAEDALEKNALKQEECLAPASPTGISLAGDSDSGDLSRSLADSGHYEDLPSPCLSSRDSLDANIPSVRKLASSLCSPDEERDNAMIWAAVNAAEDGIRAEWARRVEELKENHMEEYNELKERHNDKVEMLLSKLSDANLGYFELRPQYDKALEKIRDLEKTGAKLKEELRESEMRHQKVYLQMYLKGQQAARFEAEDQKLSESTPIEHSSNCENGLNNLENNESESVLNNKLVLTLMRQLAQSEDEIQRIKLLYSQEMTRSKRGRNSLSGRREEIDPEITLQFLKSAIYYFLTDKENAQGHLRAIESILGYSSVERGHISRHVKI